MYRRDITRSMPGEIPSEAADAARDTLGNALAVAARLPGQLGAELANVARAAFTHALRTTAVTGTIIVVALAIVVIIVLGHLKPRSTTAEPAEA